MQTIAPYRNRHAKANPLVRCCWVCGKVGGNGFTTALRGAGYHMTKGEIGYAHNQCMAKAMREANLHYSQLRLNPTTA